MDACCAVPGNDCDRDYGYCYDGASSSSWLFGLGPGPPQRFQPTGTDTDYQGVGPGSWPSWGSYGEVTGANNDDLAIGRAHTGGAPGGAYGGCHQGGTYRGTYGEICGGYRNWGATDVEVWYPR